MSIEDYDEDRSDDNSEYLECGGGGGAWKLAKSNPPLSSPRMGGWFWGLF